MIYRQLRGPAVFSAFALAVLVAGCEKRNGTGDGPDGAVASDSSREGSSMVRLVNAAPSVSGANVYADDVAEFSDVAFLTVTPFRTLKDNLVTLELRAPGAAVGDTVDPLAQNREMLSDGDRYTVVVLPAAGTDDKPTLRVLEEPTDAGEAGKARLRVVNAAHGVETFDVFVPSSTDPFFDDVDFRTEAGFKDVDAGAIRIVIRADDGGPVLLTLPERTLEAGKLYTIILTNKNASGRELEVVTIEDDAPVAH